jgi:alkanesulfonate monooxygenase SsuD/methylene tetrahydromethanopterin reductase-like flavin-dependent oxidoreductase (luciferase family)
MLVSIRYNFRNPPQWARPSAWLYNRLLDQIEWADQAGFDRVALAEHHFLEEAFLPGLLAMAAAVAARTKKVLIGTDIMLLPLHHPVRVAEDGALVDIISSGRFELSVGAGYREEEYAGFGMRLGERASRMEEGLQIVRGLWAEDEFSFHGRYYQLDKVRLTPKPVQRPGPKLILGGGAPAVARRAARLADGFKPMNPALWDIYYDELERLGRPVERKPIPPRMPAFLHVTRDPERDWALLRPHALFELEQYAAWGLQGSVILGNSGVTEQNLKASNAVWTPEEARERLLAMQADSPDCTFGFAPILAGMDPEMAQASLELIASEVLPALHAARGHT